MLVTSLNILIIMSHQKHLFHFQYVVSIHSDNEVNICFIHCRNAGINELQNLKYLPRSSTEREIFIEDRTPAHADHVGFGLDRITTAAVGKSIFSSFFIHSFFQNHVDMVVFRTLKVNLGWYLTYMSWRVSAIALC